MGNDRLKVFITAFVMIHFSLIENNESVAKELISKKAISVIAKTIINLTLFLFGCIRCLFL